MNTSQTTDQPELTAEQLLPCPFCGKQPTSEFCIAGVPGAEDCGYWGIDCTCGMAQVHADDEEYAVMKWNSRAHSASQLHSLRSELATAKERIGELEKNEDIWSRRLAEATEERRALQATIASQSEDLKKLRVCLALVLASAHPHPINNVPMYSVWREGEKVLAETMPISHSTKAEGENS